MTAARTPIKGSDAMAGDKRVTADMSGDTEGAAAAILA